MVNDITKLRADVKIIAALSISIIAKNWGFVEILFTIWIYSDEGIYAFDQTSDFVVFIVVEYEIITTDDIAD